VIPWLLAIAGRKPAAGAVNAIVGSGNADANSLLIALWIASRRRFSPEPTTPWDLSQQVKSVIVAGTRAELHPQFPGRHHGLYQHWRCVIGAFRFGPAARAPTVVAMVDPAGVRAYPLVQPASLKLFRLGG
jgi:hypothetical protein